MINRISLKILAGVFVALCLLQPADYLLAQSGPRVLIDKFENTVRSGNLAKKADDIHVRPTTIEPPKPIPPLAKSSYERFSATQNGGAWSRQPSPLTPAGSGSGFAVGKVAGGNSPSKVQSTKVSEQAITAKPITTIQPTKVPENPLQIQSSVAVDSRNLNVQQQEIKKVAGDFSKLPTKAKEEIGNSLQQVEKQKGQLKAIEDKAQSNAVNAARAQDNAKFFEKQKLQKEQFAAVKKENEVFFQKKKEEAQFFADRKRQDEAFLADKSQNDAKFLEKKIREGVTQNQSTKNIAWGSWNDYNKVSLNGNTYAQIGNRYYSRHAVDRMQPSGLGAAAGTIGKGHSFPPALVEDVIQSGAKRMVVRDGVSRAVHFSGTAEVVTEQNGKIVVSVNPFRGAE